jgi:hypothetical protein
MTMLRQATVAVPAILTRELEELAVMLRAVKAETAAAAPLDLEAEEQLRSASDLLDQVGGAAGSGEPLEITGPAGLVREALYGLLIDGADALAEACRAYESGAIPLERLTAAAASAQARIGLFAAFEREDRIDRHA